MGYGVAVVRRHDHKACRVFFRAEADAWEGGRYQSSSRLAVAIFEQGIPAVKVPACRTCHGQDAEGNQKCPRLAGQHAEYLLKQLVMFKSEFRSGASAPIMHNMTTDMTFDQMQAVAAYSDVKVARFFSKHGLGRASLEPRMA